jgi:hypothetical protein
LTLVPSINTVASVLIGRGQVSPGARLLAIGDDMAAEEQRGGLV